MSHRLCCPCGNEKLEISELERPYVWKLAELSLQMTIVFIWKLEWNGHLPRKMFLTQNDLIEKQTTLITNKGSESVVRKSFHETISIFCFEWWQDKFNWVFPQRGQTGQPVSRRPGNVNVLYFLVKQNSCRWYLKVPGHTACHGVLNWISHWLSPCGWSLMMISENSEVQVYRQGLWVMLRRERLLPVFLGLLNWSTFICIFFHLKNFVENKNGTLFFFFFGCAMGHMGS